MSFDKEYPNRKDLRKQYHGAAQVDPSCRPGGSCPYCLGNRMYQRRKSDINQAEQLRERERYGQ